MVKLRMSCNYGLVDNNDAETLKSCVEIDPIAPGFGLNDSWIYRRLNPSNEDSLDKSHLENSNWKNTSMKNSENRYIVLEELRDKEVDTNFRRTSKDKKNNNINVNNNNLHNNNKTADNLRQKIDWCPPISVHGGNARGVIDSITLNYSSKVNLKVQNTRIVKFKIFVSDPTMHRYILNTLISVKVNGFSFTSKALKKNTLLLKGIASEYTPVEILANLGIKDSI